MAFTPGTLDKLAQATVDGLEWWDYRTTDTIATVETGGYFSTYAKFFKLNEKLLVTASDAIEWYYISALNNAVTSQGVGDTTGADSVTITKSVATAGSIANSQLANMAAWTFKGNATGVSAAPQDFTITGLTAKTVPTAADLLVLSDEAATHATKNATIANVLAVGGALLSKVISFTRDITLASANVSYTGVGFQPTSIIFFGITASGSPQFSTGFSDSSKSGKSIWCYGNNTMSTSSTTPIVITDTDGTGSKGQQAAVLSYDSDGFTLNWVKFGVPGANTATIFALCYR